MNILVRYTIFIAASLLLSLIGLTTVLTEGMKQTARPVLQTAISDLPTQSV